MREAELRDRVDRLRLGHALVQRVGGLVDERHQDPVGDEAGKVARLGRRLPELDREPGDRLRRLVRGLEAADHLDELQHRHRVEEVHADHAVGAGGDGGERGDRDRRRVRSEDRRRRQHRVRAPEDLLLHARVLDDRLDSRSAGTRSSTGSTRASTSSGSGPPLFSCELPEAPAHRLEAAFGRARRRVVQRDAPARGRHDLRDPAAHLAGADDEHVLEGHARRLLRGTGYGVETRQLARLTSLHVRPPAAPPRARSPSGRA